MAKRITISHNIGELVYLRTDQQAIPRLVTRLTISQGGAEYALRSGAEEVTWHQPCEIMREPKTGRPPGYK